MRWLAMVLGFVVGGIGGWAAFGPRAVAAEPLEDFAVSAENARAEVEPLDVPPEPEPAPEQQSEAGQPERPPDVAAAIDEWVRTGRANVAAAALRKAGAADLAAELETVESLRRAGHGALLAGDLEAAADKWRQALDRERPLVTPDVLSLPAAEMRGSLAAALHERALVLEQRDQLPEAFAAWSRAASFDPTHLESLAGLQRLELKAARALAEGAGCDELQRIRAITRREGATHREAAARAARCRPKAQQPNSAIRQGE